MTSRDVGWPSARALAYDVPSPLPATRLLLRATPGCTLAEPLVALSALPAFDTAAMDGYAVAGAAPWQVIGRITAGHRTVEALRPGTAVEIATGAMVPPGVAAVIPYERAEVNGDSVTRVATSAVAGSDASGGGPPRGASGAASGPPRGDNIRPAGEETTAGALLAAAGARVTPVVAGLAAAAGHDDLLVVPRPTVALIVTGDELIDAGLPGDGLVRDGIGLMLPPLVDWLGGVVTLHQRVMDGAGRLAAALSAAAADVVVTSGASSVGRSDHLHGVLASIGAELLIDGVAVRPGHPQLLARLPDGRWLVGLPGNPLAALAAVLTLLHPLLARLGGRPAPVVGTVVAAETLPAAAAAHRLVPAVCGPDGVAAVAAAGPAMLTGAAHADGFAVVPPGGAAVKGTTVGWLPLPPRD